MKRAFKITILAAFAVAFLIAACGRPQGGYGKGVVGIALRFGPERDVRGVVGRGHLPQLQET